MHSTSAFVLRSAFLYVLLPQDPCDCVYVGVAAAVVFLGTLGSGSPAVHRRTAWGHWAAELLQYTFFVLFLFCFLFCCRCDGVHAFGLCVSLSACDATVASAGLRRRSAFAWRWGRAHAGVCARACASVSVGLWLCVRA